MIGEQDPKTGIYALNRADLFNLLCIPPLARDISALPSIWTPPSAATYQAALALCVERRAMLIVDPDPAWASSIDQAIGNAIDGRNDLNLTGTAARNAALYFPCVRQVDPLRDSRVDTFVPSGIVAGIMARTDVARGVWKAPAGLDATLNGVQDLQVNLNDLENGQLNPLGINCLRSFRRQRPRRLGRAHAARRRRAAPTSTSTCRCGASRCSSKRASTAARSGWCSSRTTSRCGRRSA